MAKRFLPIVLLTFLFSNLSVWAVQYLTEEQALKLAFPQSQKIEVESKQLSEADLQTIKKQYGIEIVTPSVKIYLGWSGSKIDGYALIDNEIGKSEPITFIIAIDPAGKVKTVAIMEFRETRGWEVKEPRFLRQFNGKRSNDHIRINDDVVNLSGATLSSYAVSRGVKKAVVLVDYFYFHLVK